jgi:glyoxylate reductase
VGYDNIDVDEARSRGVVVTNTPGVLTDATADLAMALILAVTRRLGEGERMIRAGRRWKWGLDFMLGHGLQGRELGIVGMGAIGAAVARRARAFGMRVSYAGPRPAPEDLEVELAATHLALPELLERADVVSIHAPLRADTRHLIGAPELALMKPSSYLVNTARGPIVDEEALVAALRSGAIAGAALDVFEEEPRVHPGLASLENVVLIPHLGSATFETRAAMAELAAQNAVAVASGGKPLTPVA